MSFKALYRAYRPSRFGDLVGQEVISTILKNALIKNRLSHAYLFCGPRGTGKTSSAKILAKAVNCENLEAGEPCNHCASCLAMQEDRMMDVYEIDAASNRGIENMRELKEMAFFAPAQAKYKVFIIDEVHMLTTEAFNALLKILEEPPEHILFILATTDPDKVPLTVLSRTQRFDFKRIQTKEMMAHLRTISQKEGVSITDEALFLIADRAKGGLRDALSLLDQAISFTEGELDKKAIKKILGGVDEADLIKLLENLLAKEYNLLFDQLETFFAEGLEAKAILSALTEFMRGILAMKVGHSGGSHFSKETIEAISPLVERLNLMAIERFLTYFGEASGQMRSAPNGQLVLELLFSRLIIAQKGISSYTGELAKAQLASQGMISQEGTPAREPITRTQETSAPTPRLEGQEPKRQAMDNKLPWQKIMDHLDEKSFRLYGIFRVVRHKVEGERLLLAVPQGDHFRLAEVKKEGNQEKLLESIKAVTGRSFSIEVVEPSKKDDKIIDESVKRAQALYGADKVKIKYD